MKKIKNLLKSGMTLIALLYVTSATGQRDPYPDSLKIEGSHLNTGTYTTWTKQFLRLFQVDTGRGQFPLDAADIFEVSDRKQIIDLKDALDDPKDGKGYAALKIIYGLKVDENSKHVKMVFIYVPVLLELDDLTIDRIDTFKKISGGYKLPSGETNHYYILDDTRMLVRQNTPKQIDTIQQWIANYKSWIRIDKNNSGTFLNHDAILPGGSDQDALSETFAFKSLEYFFNGDATIHITCGSKQALEHGLYTFKHYIAFANAPFDQINEAGGTHAADLGTLCPPNCLITKVNDGFIQLNFWKQFLQWLTLR